MNKEVFLKNVEALGIKLSKEQIDMLDIYASYLLEYNQHTNLTAIKEYEEVLLKHFYDSLTIVKAIDFNSNKTLVDIGTGAGFPGLVLKIVFPHLYVVLMDSNNKKVTFLNNLIKKLGLNNIEAINARSEEYALNNKDKYDIVTARAVTTLPVLTELCLPMVKVGGYFIPMKANVEDEIELSKDILNVLNGNIEEVIDFYLPIIDARRTIIKIKKTDKCPNNYPRSYDKIKKALKKLGK